MRQRHLQQQYHFLCTCPACSQGACSEVDARLVGLRCSACDGPVVPGSGCPAGLCSLQALPAELPGARQCFQWVFRQYFCFALPFTVMSHVAGPAHKDLAKQPSRVTDLHGA